MKEINDGGPAFPTDEVRFPNGELIAELNDGMSLRDYFAGQALTAIAADLEKLNGRRINPNSPGNAAIRSYEYADAMLRVREGEA